MLLSFQGSDSMLELSSYMGEMLTLHQDFSFNLQLRPPYKPDL